MIFEENCKTGGFFQCKFEEAKGYLCPKDCSDTQTNKATGVTLSLETTMSSKTHSHTRRLLSLLSVRGNRKGVAKYPGNLAEIAPGSSEQTVVESRLRQGVAETAGCPIEQVGNAETLPGSIILHFEFFSSDTCSSEQAAANYVEAITKLACASDTKAPMGLLSKDTLHMLEETGALEAFVQLKERQPGGIVTIWRRGDSSEAVQCTIQTALDRGAQAWVYEVTSDLSSRRCALKCSSFAAMKDEVLLLLRVNEGESHRNVLQIDSVYSPLDSLELLCLMELIEGPKESVRNLEHAIRDGVLYEGTDVQARLLSLGVQIAFAIEHIHSRGVVHQYIKPANILVDASDGNAHWRLVLTDFGVSSSGETMPAAGGGVTIKAEIKGCTPLFCSKGVYTKYKSVVQGGGKQHCTHAADLWCFATTMLRMYHGGDAKHILRNFAKRHHSGVESVYRTCHLVPERRPNDVASIRRKARWS